MNIKFLDHFKLLKDKEDVSVVRKNIQADAIFHGTNLWVLFFAILIASLGLNINSTAVVIGAMLISPLMGPILGVAFGVATNDLPLFRMAFRNYIFAMLIGLVSSTIYFLLTPIDDAHSEILARTLPTIYDVFIALFGGFAGIIAISSKHKGNVIPGVAIATALMPPLCTAGYGLATGQLNYFIGAMYLYLINSVFISVATIITIYYLKFPVKKYEDPSVEKREKTILWLVVLVTLIPSVYLGIEIVQQHKFTGNANRFIDAEAFIQNDFLLKRKVDVENKTIELTFGGKELSEDEIKNLKDKLKYYQLDNTELVLKQGFSFLKENKKNDANFQLGIALKKTEEEKNLLAFRLDSIFKQSQLNKQIYKEIKVQYPEVLKAIIQPSEIYSDSLNTLQYEMLVILFVEKKLNKKEEQNLKNWLMVRLHLNDLRLIFNDSSK